MEKGDEPDVENLWKMDKRSVRLVPLALLLAVTLAFSGGAAAKKSVGKKRFPKKLDRQTWVLPEDMTWGDYRAIPGVDWNAEGVQPPKKFRAALILGDFQDRKFVMTTPKGSDEAGNPRGVGGIAQDEIGDWYKRFLITEPQKLNHFHTVNEYWLEDTYGLIGIDADAFGPYTMEGKEHEYGLGDVGGAQDSCPQGDDCSKDFDTEILEASLADVNAGIVTNGGHDYDFRFLLHAGYDESGTWQEFGEMRFQDKDAVTNTFGNPDGSQPNWAGTRYVDWTSFWAAKGIWSHATPGVMSTQGENDGASTYAHEFSHIVGVLDNYNNPYGVPVRRSYSGPWDMMSRGTFNGPGGPHNRWQVPPTLGGTMGSHHMLRNKIRMGFVKPNEVLVTSNSALAASGPIYADLIARAVPLGPSYPWDGMRGIQINLTGGDQAPDCSSEEDHRCDGGGYDNYTVEVVDRVGYDSFTPDHGVLIAKTKNADTSPFIWVIDSHAKDINVVDFMRPDGTPAMVSLGDYRQLADALFHVGNGKGVVSEYVDEANELHFYVLEKRNDEGALEYRVAVRSLAGSDPAPRGVAVEAGKAQPASPGRVGVYQFDVTNSATVTDLFRLKAKSDAGWKTFIPSSVIEVPAGETVTVRVYVAIPQGTSGASGLRFTATSETDPTATASANTSVKPVL